MRAAALQRQVDENGVAACHVAHLRGSPGTTMRSGSSSRSLPSASIARRMDIKGRIHVVGDLHHRRRRGNDRQAGDLADPVDVAMAVHEDGAARQRLEAAHEPIAVDQRRADALRQRLGGPWIFDDVVVQRDHPARIGIFARARCRPPRICSADTMPSALVKEKCVSAFEFRRMMPSPSFLAGGTIMGKTSRPDLGNFLGEDRARDVGEPLQWRPRCGCQGLLQRAADAILGEIDHADMVGPGPHSWRTDT